MPWDNLYQSRLEYPCGGLKTHKVYDVCHQVFKGLLPLDVVCAVGVWKGAAEVVVVFLDRLQMPAAEHVAVEHGGQKGVTKRSWKLSEALASPAIVA